jgi:hypothetical protein
MDGSNFVDDVSALDQQVQDAKLKYLQVLEALGERVEEAKGVYHHATNENLQAAQERYIKSLNAFNSLVAAGGVTKEFEAPERNGQRSGS